MYYKEPPPFPGIKANSDCPNRREKISPMVCISFCQTQKILLTIFLLFQVNIKCKLDVDGVKTLTKGSLFDVISGVKEEKSVDPEITSQGNILLPVEDDNSSSSLSSLPPLNPPSSYSSSKKPKIIQKLKAKCLECSKIHGIPFYPVSDFRISEFIGIKVPIAKKPMDFSQKQYFHYLLHIRKLQITDVILCLDSHPLPSFVPQTPSFLTPTSIRKLDNSHLLWSLPTVMWSTLLVILFITLLVSIDYIIYDLLKTIWVSISSNDCNISFFFTKDGLSFIFQHLKYSLLGGTIPLLSNYHKIRPSSTGDVFGGSGGSNQQTKRKKSKRPSVHQFTTTTTTTTNVAKVPQPLAVPSPQRRHHSISFSFNEENHRDAIDDESFDIKVNSRNNRKKRSLQRNPSLTEINEVSEGGGGGFTTPTPTPTPSPLPLLMQQQSEVKDEELDKRRADWVRGMPLFDSQVILSSQLSVTPPNTNRRFTIHSSSSSHLLPSPTLIRSRIPTPPPAFDNTVKSMKTFPTSFTDNENSWLWFLPSSIPKASSAIYDSDDDTTPKGGQFARFSQSGRSTPTDYEEGELD